MGVVLILPRRIQNSESAFVVFGSVFVAIFIALFVVSIINVVAYMRWTRNF
jgi:hypothetical protein